MRRIQEHQVDRLQLTEAQRGRHVVDAHRNELARVPRVRGLVAHPL